MIDKVGQALPSRASFGGCLAVILVGALYVTPFCVSIGGRRLLIGNDFACLYFRYKAYLLDVLSSEHRLPLWSPAEAAGVPFFSNPFAAAFYPLNLPLAWFYKAAHGYSVADHQCFAALAVVILCAGLYAWIRSLNYPLRAAIFAAAVAGTSLKVTELIRFPNAIHAAAWMPWLLYGVNLTVQRRTRIRGMLLTAATTVMAITAGYPYLVYYLQFLLGPYVVLVLVSQAKGLGLFFHASEAGTETSEVSKTSGVCEAPSAAPEEDRRTLGGLLALAIGFGAGLAVCLPYLSRMKLFLDQMQDRGGGDFAYSTAHDWTWLDTLGSLVYPPAAAVEGWYYFGMFGLLAVLVYLIQAVHPAGRTRRELFFAAILLTWFGGITYLTMGKDSYLFGLMWDYWPGFARLRVWPRLNIVLVPLIALILARACARLRLFITAPDPAAKPDGAAPIRWLVLAYLSVLGVQIVFWSLGYVSWYFEEYMASGPFQFFGAHWFLLSGFLGFLALLVLLAARRRGLVRRPVLAAVLLAGAIGLSCLDTAPLGLTQWAAIVPDFDGPRSPLRIAAAWDAALATPRTFTRDTLSLSAAFNTGIIENWYFGRYVDFLKRCGLENYSGHSPPSPAQEAGLRVLGCADGRRLYFTRSSDHQTAEQFLADADAAQRECRVSIRAIRYNGDTLDARVECDTPGYLCFIDNWDKHWHASVNGQPVLITCLLGTFKAVPLPAGESRVRFEYRPFG